jgi:cell division protein ZapE
VSDFKPLDAAQREASQLLLELHEALRSTPPRPTGWGSRGRGLMGRLVGRRGDSVSPIPGLYLWGGVGRGKTYLMDWFVEDLDLPGKRRIHFHHFMRDVHGRMSRLPKQPDPLEVIARDLSEEVRVLCLDEFLVTDITDAMLLHGLLGALFARGLTLVTTANTRPDDLYRNGLQRQSFLPAIDLLKRHTRVFELDGGSDYRLRALTRSGVFFVAEEGGPEEAERCLEDAFERLTGGHHTGGHQSGSDIFSVNGRSFPVRRQSADVIWFDFDALCGGARSAADYIEIAREFHTVLLSGVPILGPKQEAAARRFLHLVDEFYDQRVKLLLSTAAPIDRLYSGGLIDFAHERLLSRLTEMQSETYLATPSE